MSHWKWFREFSCIHIYCPYVISFVHVQRGIQSWSADQNNKFYIPFNMLVDELHLQYLVICKFQTRYFKLQVSFSWLCSDTMVSGAPRFTSIIHEGQALPTQSMATSQIHQHLLCTLIMIWLHITILRTGKYSDSIGHTSFQIVKVVGAVMCHWKWFREFSSNSWIILYMGLFLC